MTGKISSIEITFPESVDLTQDDQRQLLEIVTRMTDRYDRDNPGRVMWAFGVGMKLLSNPFMVGDDEPLQFDNLCFSINCHERADYKWPCVRCGKPQGDHKGHIIDPPAGDCEFQATERH